METKPQQEITEQINNLTEEYKIPEYFHKPERQEGEDFEEYKKRRFLSKWLIKEIKKGTVVWPSIMKNSEGKLVGISYDKDKVKRAMEYKQAIEELQNVEQTESN